MNDRWRPTIVVTDDIRQALYDAYEYFDQRSDADHNGVRFIANTELKLASAFQAIIESIDGDLGHGEEEMPPP